MLGCIHQMFGKGLSFTQRCTKEIPGPQAKHRRQRMFVKSTVFAQLQCSRIRMLHTINAPALNRPEGVAERRLQQQLRLVAEQRVLDLRKELQTASKMVQRLGIGRASSCMLSSLEPVSDGGLNKTSFCEVVGRDFRFACHDGGKPFLKCACNLTV